jgi:hypothetical protein
MQIETEKSTEYMLEQWVRWARSHGESLSYPAIEPYTRIITTQGRSPDITDAEAMLIDGIVGRLLSRDAEMGNVTVAYYATGCNVSALVRYYRIPRKRVDVLVRAGTAWVDATRMARLEAA